MWPNNSCQELRAELSSLKETVAELKTEQRLLLHEWEETHRKLLNTLRSISRSGGKKDPAVVEIDAAAVVPSGPDQISAAIHARRGRALPNTDAEADG
jgi:prefoldin subunit 5